ncbi:unnamed protein product [Ixodes pacificus]
MYTYSLQHILNAQVLGPFLCMIGLVTKEHAPKHHDVAFFTLFDWFHRFVSSATSGLKKNPGIVKRDHIVHAELSRVVNRYHRRVLSSCEYHQWRTVNFID